MLFDLQTGRRKTVVKVVYSILALLMGGSLVLFGIGSDAPGGILDALGLGGDDTSQNPQYEQQIEDAQATLETDPENPQALLELVRYHYLSATSTGVTTDPNTGQVSITPEAHTELEDTVAAWQRYSDLKQPNPDVGAATNAAQAYRLLNDAGGAAGAQQIVADDQKTSAAYGQLAFYLYADFQFKAGDAAAEKAVAAADPSQRKQIEKSLESLAERAREEKKRIDKEAEQGGSEAGGTGIDDPFGALEGGTTDPGLAPPAPAPGG